MDFYGPLQMKLDWHEAKKRAYFSRSELGPFSTGTRLSSGGLRFISRPPKANHPSFCIMSPIPIISNRTRVAPMPSLTRSPISRSREKRLHQRCQKGDREDMVLENRYRFGPCSRPLSKPTIPGGDPVTNSSTTR